MIKEATLKKELQNGKIECLACSQLCRLDEGEYGICGVRKVENHKLKLLVYSKVAALNIDPVEKKPLYHFYPNSKTLSLGTVGCNFRCSFCQNYTISQYPQEHNFKIVGQDITPHEIVNLAIEKGCKSIAYTYNEPIIFFEYTYDIAKLANSAGLKNIYVTSGYETRKAIDLLSSYIDAMNIDLKSFNDNFYKDIVKARLKPVLDAIKYAYQKGIWIEITTLLIPGKNDSPKEIDEISKFIASIDINIPWHISAFHPTYKMKNIPPTNIETLIKAYDIGKKNGLNYIYIGNVHTNKYSQTLCPNCNNIVIKRDGYLTVKNSLEDGKCPYCNYKIAGYFK